MQSSCPVYTSTLRITMLLVNILCPLQKKKKKVVRGEYEGGKTKKTSIK